MSGKGGVVCEKPNFKGGKYNIVLGDSFYNDPGNIENPCLYSTLKCMSMGHARFLALIFGYTLNI